MRNFLAYTITIFFSFQALFVKGQTEKNFDLIDKYVVDEMKSRQIPGLTFGICNQKGLIKIKAYGFADVQNQGLVRENTVFELASLTKQFTASAIMLLVQDGKIKLSDPIKLYLPECPIKWNKITIKHLLTHTSGLPALFSGYSGYSKMSNSQLNELLGLNLTKELAFDAIKTDTLDFLSGEKFNYSDIGYELLGLIINKVTGSYRDYIQKSIFDVVGMKDSYILDQTTLHPFEARGYTLRKGKLVNIRRVWDTEIPSHYGIFSNIRDLSKWDSILNTERLLTNESKKMMWERYKLNNGSYTDYGFGWFTKTLNKKLIITHTGITGTEIIKYVNDSVSIIVLTNLGIGHDDDGTVNSWGIASHIGNMLGYNTLIDSTYTTKDGLKIIKTNAKQIKKISGTYEFKERKVTRKIYRENGKLYYDKGNTRDVLAQLSNGSFIKLGVENEEILEVKSADFKELEWKGSNGKLVRVGN